MFINLLRGGLLLLFWSASYALPAAGASPQTGAVASADIARWSLGLLMVLGVFFVCVWGVRKISGFDASGADKMRVVGGLSLGMREKVVLLQVGTKQLVLGVTPGRIQTLHVLEGEDCLVKEEAAAKTGESLFARRLMQAIKPRPDA